MLCHRDVLVSIPSDQLMKALPCEVSLHISICNSCLSYEGGAFEQQK